MKAHHLFVSVVKSKVFSRKCCAYVDEGKQTNW